MEEENISYLQAFPENGSLRILFPDRITTSNAPAIRTEIFELLSGIPHSDVIADFDQVQYISSSGLRVILELIRKEVRFKIVRVNPEPYEIFGMTGFLMMADIQKKRRQISLEGAEKIGWGFTSDVYRLDEDTIVKVFHKDIASLEGIGEELRRAKQAFTAGIPTAISYDIVEVGDCYGVVFEMMDGSLLRDAILAEPDKFDEYMEQYTGLLRNVAETVVTDPSIADMKQVEKEKLDFLGNCVLTPDEVKCMERVLGAIPDTGTYVHGDCHIKNIMLNSGEMTLIDMEMLSKGSPVFELGALYSTHIVFETIIPHNVEEFLGIPAELSRRIFDRTLEGCIPSFGLDPEEAEQLVKIIGCFQCLYMMARYKTEHPEYAEHAARLLRERLSKWEAGYLPK